MRKEFEDLESQFSDWQEIAKNSLFHGVSVKDLDQEELLAMIGCIGELLVSKDLEQFGNKAGAVGINSFSVY